MKILIAEDDSGTGKLLSFILQRRGHKVEWQWDGAEVLASVAASRPDLLIVDLELPHMNGLEIVSRLRANPDTRDVPTMMITASSDRDIVTQCKELGVLEFIVKPFKPDVLRERVQRLERLRA